MRGKEEGGGFSHLVAYLNHVVFMLGLLLLPGIPPICVKKLRSFGLLYALHSFLLLSSLTNSSLTSKNKASQRNKII